MPFSKSSFVSGKRVLAFGLLLIVAVGCLAFYFANRGSSDIVESSFFLRFQKVEDAEPGEYAMWWANREGDSFGDSDARKEIGRAYEALNGVETYAIADMMKAFGEVDSDVMRVKDQEDLMLFLKRSNNESLILTVSQEKGIRMHFNTKETSVVQRNLRWRRFADYAERLRANVLARKFPLDAPHDPNALGWWRLMEETALSMEKEGKEVNVVGTILVGAEEDE